MVTHGVSDFDPSNSRVRSVGDAGSIARNVPEVMELHEGGAVGSAFSCDSNFRDMIENASLALLKGGKIPSIYDRDNKKVPLARIDYEGSTFEEVAQGIYPEYAGDRSALNAYLLRSAACYVEVPTVRKNRETGIVTPYKTKYVATTNIDIAREWAGEGVLKPAHFRKLSSVDDNIVSSVDSDWDLDEEKSPEIPYLKLEHDRDGNPKVVSPRTGMEVNSKQNIVPLYLYKQIVDYIYDHAKSDVVRVHYVRTSGEDRVMDVTFNFDKLSEVYGEEYAKEIIEESYNGNFDDETYLHRGFIKVPSIGESRFDGVTRSMNFATIFNIEVGVTPDLTYVDVELNKAIGEFYYGAKELLSGGKVNEYRALSEALISEKISEYTLPTDPDGLEGWLNRRETLEGSTFKKKLAMFMMVTPQWFPNYMIRKEEVKSAPESRSLGLL